jgi:hypothetical protein
MGHLQLPDLVVVVIQGTHPSESWRFSERCQQSKLNPYKGTVKKLHQCAEKELT